MRPEHGPKGEVGKTQDAYPSTWPALSAAADSLLPWILTAAVEIVALQCRDAATTPIAEALVPTADYIHASLGISRLRYDVPHQALCDLVRDGSWSSA